MHHTYTPKHAYSIINYLHALTIITCIYTVLENQKYILNIGIDSDLILFSHIWAYIQHAG